MANGIIGGWATAGNEFATYDTVATAGSIRALPAASYTLNTTEGTWVPTENVKLTPAQAVTIPLTGSRTVNTLNLQLLGGAGVEPILDLAIFTLTLDAGGLILGGATNMTIAAGVGGKLTAGAGPASLGELFVHTGTGRTLTNFAPIVDNVTNTVALVKAGPGVLTLMGANTFPGPVTLNAGPLRLGNAAAISSAGVVRLNSGTLASDSATARLITNAITVGGNVQIGEAATGTAALTFNSVMPMDLTGAGASSP